MPSLSDETVTIAYLRSVADEDAEAQLRRSGPMSFVIRRAPSAFTGTERRGRNARSRRLFTPPSGPMRHGLRVGRGLLTSGNS